MNKFEIAELINNLRNRVEELESRFKINNYCYEQLFMENTRLALGIDDEVPKKAEEKILEDNRTEKQKIIGKEIISIINEEENKKEIKE